MEIKTVSDFRAAMRSGPYAWPGAYPLFFITAEGDPISFEGARANLRQIIDAIGNGLPNGWRIVALDVNWENPDLFCAETGKRIQSAYGEN
jgi:hypothetical protein